MVFPLINPVKDVFCLSHSFPSVWKRQYMPACGIPCWSSRRSTPTCRQPHSPEKSPTAQCGGCEPAPSPAGCSCCRQCQQDTAWLSVQAAAGLAVELLLSEAWTFPWSNLEEDEVEPEVRSGMRMKSSLCIWRPHPYSKDAGNNKLLLALG